MSIVIKKELTICNEEDWFRVAPPKKKEAQWKDGFSAKELAKFVTNNNEQFSVLISKIVKDCFGRVSTQFTGEPEKDTPLPPKTSHGPRNHDLLLYNDDLVIGIEAKVDEEYGDSISNEYEKAESQDKKDRINWLTETIIPGCSYEDDKVKGLRYQLFTATAGTLLEAYKKGLNRCIVLVLSFRYENKMPNKRNDDDFANFVKEVCGNSNSRIIRISIPNEPEIDIECKFIKEDIVIKKTVYEFSL